MLIHHPDTTDIIAGSIDGTIALISTDQMKIKQTAKLEKAPLSIEMLSSKIVCSTEDRSLHFIDVENNKVVPFYGPFKEPIMDMLSVDNKLILSSMDKYIYILDVEKQKVITEWDADMQLFVPSEHLVLVNGVIVCANSSNNISLWDQNGSRVGQLKGHTGSIRKIMQYKGSKFVSCGEDQRMVIWSLQGKLFSFNDGKGITSFC